MVKIIFRKIVSSLVTILSASIVSFVLLRVFPGNPARLIAGPLASEQALKAIERRLGVNQPIHVQYVKFIKDFFRGDWGFSFSSGLPVREVMASRFPATGELAMYAFLFAFSTALVLALLATYRRKSNIDSIVRALSWIGQGTPQFWFAMIALIVFFEKIPLLPGPTGRIGLGTSPPPKMSGFYTIDALLAGNFELFWNALKHLILPAISLGFVPFAFLVRLLRANLIEISSEPFIVVVRSKGIGRWVTHVRHALPNAFIPTLTASGLVLAELLTGSVLVEKVFTWPGIGSLVVDSILRQDYAVIQTFILLSACIYVFINLVVDLLYGVIDPRTRVPSSEMG